MARTEAPQRDMEPEPPPHLHEQPAGFDPVQFVRGAVKNAPWIVIAVVFHVILFAVLSIWYVTTHQAGNVAPPAMVTVKTNTEEAPVEPEAPPPEIIDRNAIPKFNENTQEGPVNPDEVIIPDAPPGRRGEITDNTDPNKEPGEYNPDPDAPANLPSGATGGTAIGVGKIGHFGTGKPSAFLSRKAGAGGRGGGGLGQGGGGGAGGSTKQTETAVMWALRWLKNHQSADGHWDTDGFDAQCKLNRCDGPGEAPYDPGSSGLALLCFLGAGETHQTGAHAANVGRALDRLCALQDAEGCIGKRSSQHFQYNHGYGALALVEAYGLTKSSKLREPAQRAVAFTLKSKNPYLGWRYNSPPDGDNDTSVTGLMVMVLRSAMLAGLEVEDVAFRDARNWIDKMTEPEFGRTGYQQRGGPPARTNEAMTRFPSDRSEALTAVGLSARLFAGEKAGTSEMIGKGAALLAARPPVWDEASGSIDLYYWYWGTLAMSQVGGSGWEQWRAHLVKALPSHQRRDTDRDARGSWDAIDAWSTEGGRVYATAMACLSSEIASRVVR